MACSLLLEQVYTKTNIDDLLEKVLKEHSSNSVDKGSGEYNVKNQKQASIDSLNFSIESQSSKLKYLDDLVEKAIVQHELENSTINISSISGASHPLLTREITNKLEKKIIYQSSSQETINLEHGFKEFSEKTITSENLNSKIEQLVNNKNQSIYKEENFVKKSKVSSQVDMQDIREAFLGIKNKIETQIPKKDFQEENKIFKKETDEIKFYLDSSISYNDAPSWLQKGSFIRTETDLIVINENSEKAIFIDFFLNYETPSIETENGLFLKGSLLKTLAGPLATGQYAQISNETGNFSIGEVSNLKGEVKATRLDGNIFKLSTGDPIFQGDLIQTSEAGSVGLVFLDKTTMSLSDGGKLVLDELVFDAASGNGSLAVDMLEGAFSFVSGEIAKTGPDAMTISTPVATIGIRGTTVAGKAAVEGNENSFTLLQDEDGNVGQILISNSAGTQTLSQVGATTSIASINSAPPPPIILSAAEIQSNYGSALEVLPPTPQVAPQPQESPPPQEDQETNNNLEEVDNAEEISEEEGTEEDEVIGGDASDEETEIDGEEIVENVEDDLLEEGEAELIEEIQDEVLTESELSDETGVEEPLTEAIVNEEFETALGDGVPADEAITGAIESEIANSNIDSDGPGEFGSNFGSQGDVTDNVLDGLNGNIGEFDDVPFSVSGGEIGEEVLDNLGGETFSLSSSDFELNTFGVGSNVFENSYGGTILSTFGENAYGEGEILTEAIFAPMAGESFYENEFSNNFFVDTFIDNYEDVIDESFEEVYEDSSLYENTIQETEVEEHAEETGTELTHTGTTANDALQGTSGDDTMYGLDGNDTIKGYAGIDTLYGGSGTDTIYGDVGNDIIYGNIGNDTLYGGSGSDTIYGGTGDDIIYGGNGSDKLYGGDGNDKFVMESFADAVDVIHDFETDDQLVTIFGPSHNYFSRSGVAHIFNNDFTYDIDANSNTLPNFINFHHRFDNIPNGDYYSPEEVSKGFDFDFYDTNGYYDASNTIQSDFMILTGDGTDSAIFHWNDTDYDGSFYNDDTELTLMGRAEGFDNQLLTESQLSTSLTV